MVDRVARDLPELVEVGINNMDSLYSRPIPSRRGGALYNAFSYPTKIDAEAIALFIATHTQPGSVVLDPFGGSGSTGLAARLCDKPTDRMLELASSLGLDPKWGPRCATVYELSPIGSLLTQVMCKPPEVDKFMAAAHEMVTEVSDRFEWLYSAKAPNGKMGMSRYLVWSEVLRTPCCCLELSLWDASIELDPVVFKSEFSCPACGSNVSVATCDRVTVRRKDRINGKWYKTRKRIPVRMYGRTGKKTWSREPSIDDVRSEKRARQSNFNFPAPRDDIFWGDLYRSGYHLGINRISDLYTPRNLFAIGALWAAIQEQPRDLQDALRLLVLSYNASHSTLMTRVVAKTQQKDLVVTGAQSGVLYISGLPVEKNVFAGVRRKIKTFSGAFSETAGSKSSVHVVNSSSTKLDLADNSVDYVFTDPPFGDYIPYAEVNQVNEAWIGNFTNRTEEAIVSRAQGKGFDEYGALQNKVFGEVARVLKPTGAATVIFHASKPAVWHAIGSAFRENGLHVHRTSILEKTQVSFKQIVNEGGTKGDAVFLLRPGPITIRRNWKAHASLNLIIDDLECAATENQVELTPKRLYSRYVGLCVEQGTDVEVSAPTFYKVLQNRRMAAEDNT